MVYPLHSELASRGIEPHRQAAIPPQPVPRIGESRANLVEGLHAQDTFNIVNFANTTQQLSTVSLGNTPAHRQKALQYIDRLRAGGGTEMLRGLKTVLNLPQLEPERIRNIVLLTDGYIGNETQIFAEVKRSLPPSGRLHSFGAGSSVNRFLLNRVAEFGRGISQVVRHDEPIETVVDQFFLQINNPVLGNLSLQWEGPGEAPSFYPAMLPDLFAEQPLVIKGRKTDAQAGRLRIHGLMAEGQRFEQCFEVSFDSIREADTKQEPASSQGNPAISQLWARARIKELMNQMVHSETVQGVEAVTETALAYQLLCQYTAFVAVSDEVRVEHPDQSVSVDTPVMMPEAISHAGVYGMAQPTRAAISRPVPQSVRLAMSPPPVMELARKRMSSPPGSAPTPLPKASASLESAFPQPKKASRPIPRPKKVSPPQKSSRAIPEHQNESDGELRGQELYRPKTNLSSSARMPGQTRAVQVGDVEPLPLFGVMQA